MHLAQSFRTMNRIPKILISTLIASIATLVAIWGLLEPITYFTGDWLRNFLGHYWLLLLIGISLIWGLITSLWIKREPQLRSFILLTNQFLKKVDTQRKSYFY